MMTIFCIPDMERFLRIVEDSRGKVLLHLPDKTLCDLKRDSTAVQLLRMVCPGRERPQRPPVLCVLHDGECLRMSRTPRRPDRGQRGVFGFWGLGGD